MKPKKSDMLDGVKTFTIGGRMAEQRLRCLGMTNEERRWRAQWLKDQVLSPLEPKDVPEFYKDTTNIFRRLYKTPMYWFYCALKSRLGHDKAFFIRHTVGKATMFLAGLYVCTYYCKYHSNDFTMGKTLEIFRAREMMFPEEPNYPNYYKKKDHEFYDQGFYSSVLCQKVEPPPPPPPPPPSPPPPPEGSSCPAKDTPLQ